MRSAGATVAPAGDHRSKSGALHDFRRVTVSDDAGRNTTRPAFDAASAVELDPHPLSQHDPTRPRRPAKVR